MAQEGEAPVIDLKANQFLVWDELNCDDEDAEECGRVITALDPQGAAVAYAEADTDGYTDGLYHESAQPLIVMDAVGRKFRCEVGAEMVPHFRVVKREVLS